MPTLNADHSFIHIILCSTVFFYRYYWASSFNTETHSVAMDVTKRLFNKKHSLSFSTISIINKQHIMIKTILIEGY